MKWNKRKMVSHIKKAMGPRICRDDTSAWVSDGFWMALVDDPETLHAVTDPALGAARDITVDSVSVIVGEAHAALTMGRWVLDEGERRLRVFTTADGEHVLINEAILAILGRKESRSPDHFEKAGWTAHVGGSGKAGGSPVRFHLEGDLRFVAMPVVLAGAPMPELPQLSEAIGGAR